jgi:hypothetical protein
MRAAVEVPSTYRQDEDDEDDQACATSCSDDCEVPNDYLGTSLKSDKYLYVDYNNTNYPYPYLIGCAKVAFEAHRNSHGTV